MKYSILLLLLLPFCVQSQIQLLNDEFNALSSLSANWKNINEVEQWNSEHLEEHDINSTKPGALYMMPWTSSWYQNWRGTLLYNDISGDFIFSTMVSVTNRLENGLPSSNYSLAGLMIRTPRDYPNGATNSPGGWTAGGENYIFLAAGRGTGNGPQFEVKTTTNSSSSLEVSNISDNENVEIRVARIGAVVIVLNKMPQGNWEVHERFFRSDFPNDMQIGFVTYTDWPKVNTYDPYFHNTNILNANLSPDPSSNSGLAFTPDLKASFEYGRFDELVVPNELTGINLFSQATDAQLLSFLGLDSTPFCPENIEMVDNLDNGRIGVLEAVNTIQSESVVENSASLRLSAGDSITLEAGFGTGLESNLEIVVEGCTQ